jgi:hypothetical protein
MNGRLSLNVSLTTEEDIESAVKFFNNTMQWAGWNAMPEHTEMCKAYNCPILIKQKIEGERKLHTDWHRLQTLESKILLNTGTQRTPH